METMRRTHPMFVVAAASVTALSLTGIAVLGGWLPLRTDSSLLSAQTPPALVQPAPAHGRTDSSNASPASARSANRAVQSRPASRQVADDTPLPAARSTVPVSDSGIYAERARPAAVCGTCGTIESVREVTQPGEGSWIGSVAGGVVGGLLGNQIGRGNGRALATVAGAVGGAFAGHEVEKHVRTDRQYEITVRFDDGSVRTFTDAQAPAWRSGDRVRLDNGQLNGI